MDKKDFFSFFCDAKSPSGQPTGGSTVGSKGKKKANRKQQKSQVKVVMYKKEFSVY